MTTTVEAIYENGALKLSGPLPLPDQTHVLVTIRTGPRPGDPERAAWLKLSEESLTKAWDNPDDDVFNELLSYKDLPAGLSRRASSGSGMDHSVARKKKYSAV